jgi:hypothetical protein
MFMYIELWQPRRRWFELPMEQREEFLSQLAANVDRMKETGVELVGFAVCDEPAPNDAECRYMAVWRMPGKGHVHMLEKAVREEGWYNYFDVINARGRVLPVSAAVSDMVKV